MQTAVEKKLTAALSHAAKIGELKLQRAVLDAILDLHTAWRTAAQKFVARQSELISDADSHINQVATEIRVNEYAYLQTGAEK